MTIKWLNTYVRKNPMDLIIMQEILYETKPTLLIECGTQAGGSAVFFASILDLAGVDFRIYTIDVMGKPSFGKYESKITFIRGSSLDPAVFNHVKIESDDRVAVFLDSLHTYEQVKEELEIWSKVVTPGQYLICEDTVVDVCLGWRPAAHQAALDFQKDHPEFEVRKDKERLEFTFNYDGYMLRK
jgi:cephalosporin hydroxylase